MHNHIIIDNLSVKFPTKHGYVCAVDNQSLKIPQGKITGIIGETGSGKSVLGLSILRLLQSNPEISGKIYLGEKDLTTMTNKEISKIRGKEIALVAQNPATSLNPSIIAGKQIAQVYQLANFNKKESKAKTLELLKMFGFENPEKIYNAYPFTLSGGMRQRILTAIAIAAEPQWIIADEPTKGLDAILRNQVYDLFRKVHTDFNVSFLIITHDLLLARKLCDNILVMYCGCILEENTAENIFNNPQHPYTKGLIKSLPNNGMVPMKGFSPAFTDLPTGCVFNPRCPNTTDLCQSLKPTLNDYQEGKVSCHGFVAD